MCIRMVLCNFGLEKKEIIGGGEYGLGYLPIQHNMT
jgi:hypothetical protein